MAGQKRKQSSHDEYMPTKRVRPNSQGRSNIVCEEKNVTTRVTRGSGKSNPGSKDARKEEPKSSNRVTRASTRPIGPTTNISSGKPKKELKEEDTKLRLIEQSRGVLKNKNALSVKRRERKVASANGRNAAEVTEENRFSKKDMLNVAKKNMKGITKNRKEVDGGFGGPDLIPVSEGKFKTEKIGRGKRKRSENEGLREAKQARTGGDSSPSATVDRNDDSSTIETVLVKDSAVMMATTSPNPFEGKSTGPASTPEVEILETSAAVDSLGNDPTAMSASRGGSSRNHSAKEEARFEEPESMRHHDTSVSAWLPSVESSKEVSNETKEDPSAPFWAAADDLPVEDYNLTKPTSLSVTGDQERCPETPVFQCAAVKVAAEFPPKVSGLEAGVGEGEGDDPAHNRHPTMPPTSNPVQEFNSRSTKPPAKSLFGGPVNQLISEASNSGDSQVTVSLQSAIGQSPPIVQTLSMPPQSGNEEEMAQWITQTYKDKAVDVDKANAQMKLKASKPSTNAFMEMNEWKETDWLGERLAAKCSTWQEAMEHAMSEVTTLSCIGRDAIKIQRDPAVATKQYRTFAAFKSQTNALLTKYGQALDNARYSADGTLREDSKQKDRLRKYDLFELEHHIEPIDEKSSYFREVDEPPQPPLPTASPEDQHISVSNSILETPCKEEEIEKVSIPFEKDPDWATGSLRYEENDTISIDSASDREIAVSGKDQLRPSKDAPSWLIEDDRTDHEFHNEKYGRGRDGTLAYDRAIRRYEKNKNVMKRWSVTKRWKERKHYGRAAAKFFQGALEDALRVLSREEDPEKPYDDKVFETLRVVRNVMVRTKGAEALLKRSYLDDGRSISDEYMRRATWDD